jgi:hypothetical protein
MTTIAVSTETPTIVCPPWCTIPYAEHVGDLPAWEGYVIHYSATRDGVRHSRAAFVDNEIDPTEPPLVYVVANAADGMELEAAESLARAILAAVAEARS